MAFVISDSERTLWYAQICALARGTMVQCKKGCAGLCLGSQAVCLWLQCVRNVSLGFPICTVSGSRGLAQSPLSAFHSWFYKDEFQAFKISLKGPHPPLPQNRRNVVSRVYWERSCGCQERAFVHLLWHTLTHFRNFTVRFLGSGLALPAMSLESLHKDPPGLRKLLCRVAQLFPVTAWSN